MKKLFPLVLAALIILSIAGCAPSGEEAVTINVYNWGQYISDGSDGYIDVNAEFTRQTGIKVNYTTYDSNETLYTKLKTGGSSYDIIIPSDYMVARLIDEGMLEKIDFSNIPNYKYIDETFKGTEYDPGNEYSVPYTWGTVGLIYNTKYVTEEVTSWETLWNEAYSGKILMFDNPRDAFGIAQLLLGFALNTENETELRAAADKLIEQKPLVQSYVMDQIFAAMEREEAWLAPYYAGDYLMMSEENENLAFCFPKEGFNIFIDALCIPKDSKNKAAAEAYINFLCSPEVSGQNLEYLGYSTPISAAKEYMDREVSENDIAYPSEETLSRAQSFVYLSPGTTQLMDELWLSVKTDGGGLSALWYIIIALAVLAAATVIYITVSKKKKTAERRRQKRESKQ